MEDQDDAFRFKASRKNEVNVMQSVESCKRQWCMQSVESCKRQWCKRGTLMSIWIEFSGSDEMICANDNYDSGAGSCGGYWSFVVKFRGGILYEGTEEALCVQLEPKFWRRRRGTQHWTKVGLRYRSSMAEAMREGSDN